MEVAEVLWEVLAVFVWENAATADGRMELAVQEAWGRRRDAVRVDEARFWMLMIAVFSMVLRC